MSASITIERVGPLTTVQDWGRYGMLRHGISASGPMDRTGYLAARQVAQVPCGAAIEFSSLGLCVRYSGPDCVAGFAGGAFSARLNGQPLDWPGAVTLHDGDVVDITTGPAGNFGYLRFARQIAVPALLGSRSTNLTAGLGGYEGRTLARGDVIQLFEAPLEVVEGPGLPTSQSPDRDETVFRVIWGIHAHVFRAETREAFCNGSFRVSPQMNRMGMRLDDPEGIFSAQGALSLVSDAIVPGDIQILGNGEPIVLLRDHQPTGGYPRIATIIDADIDRFAQIRPGTAIMFQPVSIDSAYSALMQVKQ